MPNNAKVFELKVVVYQDGSGEQTVTGYNLLNHEPVIIEDAQPCGESQVAIIKLLCHRAYERFCSRRIDSLDLKPVVSRPAKRTQRKE
jgi:hypothetical protein